jgi:UDP-2-acetamido-3-amino-2,3-dideoxy-glucuronate N-acetyltransferase
MICPESGLRYRLSPDGSLRCLDLPEDAAIPAEQAVGKRSYDEFKPADTGQHPISRDQQSDL